MKKYLYVDTENLGSAVTEAFRMLDESWRACFFYSEHSAKLSFADVDALRKSGCRCDFVPSRNGQANAMDFCIAATLGMMVQKHPRSLHVVWSSDKGFLASIEMLRRAGYMVCEVNRDNISQSFRAVQELSETLSRKEVRRLFLESVVPEGVPLLPSPDQKENRRVVLEMSLEKMVVRILIEQFHNVGVDRRRKIPGRIVKKGITDSCTPDGFQFDLLAAQLRKLNTFKDDEDSILKFRGALSELAGPELSLEETERADA